MVRGGTGIKGNAPGPEQVDSSSSLSALILVSISILLFFVTPRVSPDQTMIPSADSLLGFLLGVLVSLLNFRSWKWVVGLVIRAATLFTQSEGKKKAELFIRLKLITILSLKILLILLVVYSLADREMVGSFLVGLVGHLLLGIMTLFFLTLRGVSRRKG